MTYDPSYRRILHKMGYYNYQQGLIYHHLNQEGGWDSHHRHCRNFILKAIDYYRPEKITVLGSGWLLDLPLAEMAEKTGKVILADIIHPPDVITQTAGMKNIELVEQDITGGLIKEIWKRAGERTFLNKLTSLDGIHIPEYQLIDNPGMIISLNILTQLEALPEILLKKKSRATEAQLLDFRKEVQLKHLRFLQRYKSVLITDKAEVITETGGKTTEKTTLLVELPDGKASEEWDWNFDLKGSDYNRKRSLFKMAGIII